MLFWKVPLYVTCFSEMFHSYVTCFSEKFHCKYMYHACLENSIENSSLIWAVSWENLLMPYANNNGADQTAHPRSLISAFVFRDCIIPLLVIAEIWKNLASLCSWAGRFESYLVETPEGRVSRDVAQFWKAHLPAADFSGTLHYKYILLCLVALQGACSLSKKNIWSSNLLWKASL